jgi:hypothetical protein
VDGKPGKNPYKSTCVPGILVVKRTSLAFRMIQPVLGVSGKRTTLIHVCKSSTKDGSFSLQNVLDTRLKAVMKKTTPQRDPGLMP